MRLFSRQRAKRFENTALPHLADVYRLARHISNQDYASELVQETYLRAWKYFDSFTEGTNCRSWLFKILHNVWHDNRNQRRLEIPLTESEDNFIEPYYDWEDELIRNELPADLLDALTQVPAVYRWAILLADVEELSYQEIARVMDCPVGTVMSRINRGRKTLARLLRSERTARAEDFRDTATPEKEPANGL